MFFKKHLLNLEMFREEDCAVNVMAIYKALKNARVSIFLNDQSTMMMLKINPIHLKKIELYMLGSKSRYI